MTTLNAWAWAAGAPIRLLLIGVIRGYRLTFGLMLGGQCRFYPSCSHYAEMAIREVGWVRGTILAIWRVLRCQPFSAGGADHPPARRGSGGMVVSYNPLYDNVVSDSRRGEPSGHGAMVESWPEAEAVGRGERAG